MVHLDTRLFHFINLQLSTSRVDPVMRFISSPWLWWAIFMASLAGFIALKKFSWIRLWAICLLAVGLTDACATYVLKPLVARPRPCHSLREVRLETACVSPFGFPSNHAANGMALPAVSAPALPLFGRAIMAAAVLLVGFSRIYLGVHFPGDVLAGFLLGGLIGFTVRRVATSWWLRHPVR